MAPRAHVDECVHCGFCLPVCPTWHVWGAEMDSPRGRIDLVKAVRDGRIAMDEEVALHLDRCLGCMACLPACPSGVRYDRIIEEARAARERAVPRGAVDRLHRALLFAVLPYPRRLRVAAVLLWLYRATGLAWLARVTGLTRLLSRRLAAAEGLAPPVSLAAIAARLPAAVPAQGPRRLRVGLVTGCVQGTFFPGVNAATARVLAAEGCEVVVPGGQGCCGALSVHAGRLEESRRMVRALIERFEVAGVELVVVNSAGCGSHLKDCERLFEGDGFFERARAFSARVRDVNELVASLEPRAPRHPIAAKVAFHAPCHLAHAQRVGAAPRALLTGIPGLEVVDVGEAEGCCGSAGVYNLVQPEAAEQVGARKAQAVLATGAPWLASANPGCTLHVLRMLRERSTSVRAAHPIEFLDASIRGLREPEG
ncbi:MAG: heterodisulfide reductase-related iron-sulfur binding cluster [Anaeromyxobacteraceae bacterium]